MAPNVQGKHRPACTLTTTAPGVRFRYLVPKGAKHQAADALSRLETNGHDIREIDDDLPGDLALGAISDSIGALDLDDTHDDARLYPDSCAQEAITNVVTRSQSVHPARSDTEKSVPEAYADEPALLNVQDIIRAQARDHLCKLFRDTVGLPGTEYSTDVRGLLVRTSPIGQSIQIVAPKAMRNRIMYFAHNSMHAGHPGSSRMYSTLRRSYYWPNMAGDIQDYVAKCTSCAKTKETQYRAPRELHLFTASEPLSFIALDLLSPLPKSQNGHEHVLIMTDRFTKFTRTIPLKSTTSECVTDTFLVH